jgi:hypothetical protein
MATRALCGVRKKTGDLCRQGAGWGTKHLGAGPCRKHGGNLPNVTAHYEVAQFMAEATANYERMMKLRGCPHCPHCQERERAEQRARLVATMDEALGDLDDFLRE